MSDLFLKIVNMSISASWLVLAVLLLRLLLKKAPKWVNVLLWAMVAVRLICPFSIESALSLIPSAETISPDIMMDPTPTIQTGVPAINNVVNPVISESFAPAPEASANPLQVWIPFLAVIWIVGIAALLIYTAISYWRLRRKVREAVILRDNIFQSENVVSPFVLGIIKPRIYLPYHMGEQELAHVVAHEQAHIQRRDHWWKPLGFLLLTVYWFNPLMWLAYVLLCRDIELACDEKVIKDLGSEQRADYTQALVACSVSRRTIAACPLAFGEVGVKERVKSVMNYKKPAFWIVVLAVIACVAVAVCFLTNPLSETMNHTSVYAGNYKLSELLYTNKSGPVTLYGQYRITNDYQLYVRNAGYEWSLVQQMEKYPLTVDELKEYADYDNGWHQKYRVKEITDAYIARVEDDHFYLVMQTKSGDTLLGYVWEDVSEASDDTAMEYLYKLEIASDLILRASILEIHDGYYLVEPVEGSWELSSADRIEVPIRNAHPSPEPEVGDIIEIEYSGEILETYPAQIADVYGIRVVKEKTLSLNDVIILSQKGYDLTWADFEQYRYIETGSGLYIRVYEINDMYELWIGGGSPDTDPMYIYLQLSDDRDTKIDIRDGGVTEFISEHNTARQEDNIETAISKAILEHYASGDSDGLIHVESHVLLANEAASGTPLFDQTGRTEETTVYLLVFYETYSTYGGTLESVGGSYVPVALTFTVSESGEYTIKEYWEPRDGNDYVKDIRTKFPGASADDALNEQAYLEDLKAQNLSKAQAYLNSTGALDVRISELLDIIQSSPAESSRPGDYIEAHETEYQELLGYGEYTLRYCFSEFLSGNQIGLRGHIMACACRDISSDWGEALLYDGLVLMTGQDWFDVFKSNAVGLSEQFSEEEMKKFYPASWLLLQMMDE